MCSRSYILQESFQLPPKSIVLTSAFCKIQLIEYITESLLEKSSSLKFNKSCIIIGSKETPTEIFNGTAIDHNDLKTSHGEADVIMVQQAYKKVLNHGTYSVSILCDDTDVLILY